MEVIQDFPVRQLAGGKARAGAWVAVFLTVWTFPLSVAAQEGAEFFADNCVICHTIGGGRLGGPDLKGVTERKDREWLIQFLLSPQAAIDSGDPYAQQLLQEARGIVMPDFPEMTPELASALLDFIEAQSKPTEQEPEPRESQPEGAPISDRPFTAEDVEHGKQIFLGNHTLANGGAACFSCHAMRGLGRLGGGRLGPELTRVYERLQGRKGLAAWLSAPPTTTMRSVFGQRPLEPEEITALIAYLEDSAKQGGQAESAVILGFFFLALGGTVVALISLDAIWKWRFRAVRAPLTRVAGLGKGMR